MCRGAGLFGKAVKGLPLGALSDLCGSTPIPFSVPASVFLGALRGEAGCLNRAFLRVLRALCGKSPRPDLTTSNDHLTTDLTTFDAQFTQ